MWPRWCPAATDAATTFALCVCVWQIFDLRLRRFAEGLEQDHPSLDGSLGQRQRLQATPQGRGVAGELDALNARYLALAEDLAKALDRQVRSPPVRESLSSSVLSCGPPPPAPKPTEPWYRS